MVCWQVNWFHGWNFGNGMAALHKSKTVEPCEPVNEEANIWSSFTYTGSEKPYRICSCIQLANTQEFRSHIHRAKCSSPFVWFRSILEIPIWALANLVKPIHTPKGMKAWWGHIQQWHQHKRLLRVDPPKKPTKLPWQPRFRVSTASTPKLSLGPAVIKRGWKAPKLHGIGHLQKPSQRVSPHFPDCLTSEYTIWRFPESWRYP